MFRNYLDIVNNGRTEELRKGRKDILSILSSVLEAIDPYKITFNYLKNRDFSDYGDIYLLAFGKASLRMAEGAIDAVDIKEGIVITTENRKVERDNIGTFQGDHPIPTERNIRATEEALKMIKRCKEKDLLIVLISGGGSSLLCKPRIPLEDMRKLTELLLKCGADIKEINTLRKHLSHVKGGQLLRFVKCSVLSCIISDVVGDPVDSIASGPTAPDTSTFHDAREILIKYDLWKRVPSSVRDIIRRGINGQIEETPKTGDRIFQSVENVIIANNELACRAAKRKAEEMGYRAEIISSTLTGDARVAGKELVEYLSSKSRGDVIISGGETTVKVRGKGKGGRNQEMVLSVVDKLERDMLFVSFATDGIDGNSDAAGAVADGYTRIRAEERGLDFRKYLEDNDSYHFFKELRDLLITGRTGTNVMDIQMGMRC